jgi:2,4-dienoyl-CoA reductase-like NADH-dependent reductase (Old Yellow Enzyme family)/thioredoxin reductase
VRHLFTPLALGTTELQNRVVSTAHQTTLVEDHLPTPDFVAYHEARARGGVGLIVLEATAVHPTGLLTPHTLGGYLPEMVAGYRRVASAVQPHGTRLFVQLFHGGREQIATPPRPPAVAPSAVPSARFRAEPRSLRSSEIEDIIAGYGRSAAIAAEGGIDGLEISAAHRYLIEQFLDPALNRRTDAWRDGARFLTAVVRSVREAAPGLCLGVRLSADSERAERIAPMLADAGIDYVSVALGDSSSYRGSVGIVPPPPIAEAVIEEHAGRFAVGPALIATSRVLDVEVAERLLADTQVDAVGMTRALIADPELVAKARAGAGGIVRCIGCNTCIAHYHAETPIACAVNPRTGRELRFDREPARVAKRRVVVVGGGPAGIAAAAEAARGGHEVILLEREQRLGGQIALAGAAPAGKRMAGAFLESAARDLQPVDVRLGVRAGLDEVLAFDPAAALVATGARPYTPPLELEGVEVVPAWDVLAGARPAGADVIVADWGGDPSGLDASELLAAAGKRVRLAVASVAVGELVHQYRRNLYLQRLYRAGVPILHHYELHGVAAGVVCLRNVFAPERVTELSTDALVLALGRVPEDDLAPSLAGAGVRVEEAGDCLSPRSLEEAVLEGTLAARRLVA